MENFGKLKAERISIAFDSFGSYTRNTIRKIHLQMREANLPNL
ncbi:hypothetical protein SAMN02910343_01230 [Dialister histaminiformans]|uniref:Uncharacterized protein n=1 Tax=Allisonella histaminiformans TaxID=209880 RepID=A0A1G5W936_9FIRM|nr:hypothetical protein [Allisonella histaminiformans]SDA54600.1 hypothetical protein SAMN02910343_01230 [Allisonella histaminiformans]